MRRRGGCGKKRTHLGDHYVIDDISGFKVFASDTRILSGDEKGLVVHYSQYESPNPQLYLRSTPDNQNVQPIRSEPPEYFLAVPFGGTMLCQDGALMITQIGNLTLLQEGI